MATEDVCALDFYRGWSVRFSLRRSGRSSDFCLHVFPGVCTHHLSHEALQLRSGTVAVLFVNILTKCLNENISLNQGRRAR